MSGKLGKIVLPRWPFRGLSTFLDRRVPTCSDWKGFSVQVRNGHCGGELCSILSQGRARDDMLVHAVGCVWLASYKTWHGRTGLTRIMLGESLPTDK